MKRLYATRNKIAHRGDVSTEDVGKCFDLSEPDATTALRAVCEAFDWFGVHAPPFHARSLEPMKMVEWGRRCIET
jgi:hypothetical protein